MTTENERFKTPKMKRMEASLGRELEAVLPELYEKHGSMEGAAGELGISVSTFSFWMMRLRLSLNRKITAVQS